MPRLIRVVDDQGVVADRGVEVRPFVESFNRGAGDEGQIGEREPFLRLEGTAFRSPRALYVLVVSLEHDERVRRGRLGPDHVLRRAAPDVGERDDLVRACKGHVRPFARRSGPTWVRLKESAVSRSAKTAHQLALCVDDVQTRQRA